MDKIILKERINKFDNIKGLAIILIVVGHLLITNDFSLKLLKNFLFIIHLPLFFFVSGYFSKIGPGELLKSFKRIMIPYIIFCILFKIYFYIPYFQLSYYPIFIYPEYGLWFLLSIFTMKMILPLFNKLKYPISFSIILAMIIGFININQGLLAITKTICYMPIFLMGFTYKKHEEIIKNKYSANKNNIKKLFNSDKFMAIILILIMAICVMIAYTYQLEFIKFNKAYSFNGIDPLFDIIKRAFLIIVQLVFVLLVNRLMTNEKTILTKIGINSMAIYLLHLPFKRIFLFIMKRISITNPLFSLIIALITSALLVYILSRDPISKYLNKIFELAYNLFFNPIISRL